VQITGNSVFSDSLLHAVLGIPADAVSPIGVIRTGLGGIERWYAAHDYTLARLTRAEVDSAGLFSIRIDEAPLAGINLTGNTTVKNWVILRSFPLQRGTPYNRRTAARGMADLHASGLFEQVTSAVVHSPDGPRLQLAVSEKSTDALRLGFHHNLEYQSEAFIEWAKTNLLGLGNELTAHAQYAPRREHHFVRLKADRVLRTYLTAAIRLYHHDHERHVYRGNERAGSFETTRDGYEITLGQNISRIAQMALVLNAEDINLEIDAAASESRHARLMLLARIDDRDDDDFPLRGRRLVAQLYWGDDFFGGRLVYRAFASEAEWIIPLRRHLALSIGGRFGNADRVLPIHERFALGGQQSFMGLAEDQLLGDRMAALTLGARYRLYPRCYVTARLDAGNAWAKGSEIRFWDALRLGAGAGLLFDTPLGPLAITEGIVDGGHSKFYFHWGHGF
jgi:outer membrane protein assembly factor BamA